MDFSTWLRADGQLAAPGDERREERCPPDSPLTSGTWREAIVVDEEGMLRGLVTQTDLLAAVALRA